MLMATIRDTYACLPATQRGRGILLGCDPASSWISYCNGKSVILRSLDNPVLCDVYTEHAYTTTVARFSPNGEWVASGDASGQVRVWARGPGHTLRFEIRALSGSVDDLQWSADGQRIVCCGDAKGSQFIRAFMWDSGISVGEFEGHSKRVLSCSIRPSRPFRVATSGEDFLVNFYEGPPFRFSVAHRDHSNYVNCVRYSPDGSRFITVGSDKKGILFDGKTGLRLGQLALEGGHTGSIYAASWSPDGKQVLTVSADKTAKIWDISEEGSGKLASSFSFSDKPTVDDMQVGCLWLPSHIITVSLNGDINFLSTSSLDAPVRILSGHTKYITAMSLAPSEPQEELVTEMYSCSYDGVTVRWRLGGTSIGRLRGKGHATAVTGMAVGGGQLITCGLDDKVRQIPLPAEDYSQVSPTDLGGQPADLCIASSDPGLVIVPLGRRLVLLRNGKLLSSTAVPFDACAAALSPSGTEAIVGGLDHKLRVYAVQGDALAEEAVLERHRGSITAVRYSPNGAFFASGDQKPEVLIWDSRTREVKVKNLLYHTARISSLAWSPDSCRVATGSLDNNIIVWEVEKPPSSRITIKGAHTGGVTALAFQDKVTLVSAGDDACLRTWTLPLS